MQLDTPLSRIAGIGPNYAKRLERLNLLTIGDLIRHYPFRYDDFSTVSSVMDAQVDQKVTLQGEIWSISNIYTRSRKILTKAIFNDGTTPIELTWFNQSWLTKQIAVGDRLQISGKITKFGRKFSILMPQWEKVSADTPIYRSTETLHTGRLVPVYPETEGVTSKWLRTKIARLLPITLHEFKDTLPEAIKDKMLNLPDALNKIHFPKDYQEAEQARDRLGFDELFFIQLATLKTRSEWDKKLSVDKFVIKKKALDSFIKKLPFKLTSAQKRVTNEILVDLKKGIPMNRLVQGEVGSGKTIVAAIAMYAAYLNGFKSLYMAPTEILAFQHHSTISRLLEPFGITVGIYTGSKKFTKTKPVIANPVGVRQSTSDNNLISGKNSTRIASGSSNPRNDDGANPDIIIGTHALLSSKLTTENTGLVIVDEQQRFGVGQRTLLRSKAKIPHFLTMTATPIPRTVALTLYGDLDLSVIDELPKGRKPVRTHVVPSKKRADAYEFIKKHVKEGDQVYIITPLIEESETIQSVKAAKVEFERLQKDIFPLFKLGLLHGRLKSKEKEQVLNNFKDQNLDILVSTSVVEVGVDVTNATIMVIEGAERFGLAQLHQLRGRVGRGEKESFCFLFLSVEEKENINRLKNLETISDGMKLSELDLKIRGSGQIFGVRQSGRFELKIASFSNLSLIEKTRTAAQNILTESPTLDKYPLLQAQLHNLAPNVMPD
jgi:ATP-dependent DNA helicase RecG